ncbi:MAG: hypothetical protein NVSMB3_02020 [Acidobacteriaceae bacterium]
MVKFTLSALLFATAVAGAQTVTVGTTTSTQNGATTTINVPVSVALPPATTVAGGAPMVSLRVEAGDSNGNTNGQSIGSSFATVALSRVVTDTASGWNASASSYTVPVTGTYLIISNLRLVDALPAGLSYGQGVNTGHFDSPSYLWNTTAGYRNGFSNMRIAQLSAGQVVDLFASIDASRPVGITSASLSIQQLQ